MPSASVVRWNVAAAMQAIGDELERRFEKAAMLVESTAIRKLSRGQAVRRLKSGRLKGLDPSHPGEPPKVLYGRLRQSIAHVVARQGADVAARIGSNVVYAPFLEYGTNRMAARPFLRPSLEENRDEIRRILTAP
jgi:HK97 gp10 family phage protein